MYSLANTGSWHKQRFFVFATQPSGMHVGVIFDLTATHLLRAQKEAIAAANSVEDLMKIPGAMDTGIYFKAIQEGVL